MDTRREIQPNLMADLSQQAAPGAAESPALLMDLRPCYEGFSGIPQESRLLFSMFSAFRLRRFGGLASGIHFTSRQAHVSPATPFLKTLEQAKAIISQDSHRSHWPMGVGLVLPGFLRQRLFKPYLLVSEPFRSERLTLRIDQRKYEDFLWMTLFDRTLPPQSRTILQRAEFYATEMGHEYARSLSMLPRIFQRRLNTVGWDVFFAASVSPYRVLPGTTTMIRYYDALPLLSPHTVGEPWPHALSHARMLRRNMADGAHFFCDSEPVRADLLDMFPDAENRVHTIPVTVSAECYPEPRPQSEIRRILLRRSNTETGMPKVTSMLERLPKLFMAVSTLEPRKNYLKLFRAFDLAREMSGESIQLLVVANRGWRSQEEQKELRAMVAEGAFHLSGVHSAELRKLYTAAHCVIAPSRAEGFDYSGAEAMACGTPVLASDIPVHRWVYGNAAEYFDPYDEQALARLIVRFAGLSKETGHLALLRERGSRQARLYAPSALAPRWESALEDLTHRRSSHEKMSNRVVQAPSVLERS